MSFKISKLELITEKGTFTFAPHFNSDADAYQALCLFEANNWEMLGETSYKVFQSWPDGTENEVEFNGLNASAYLAEYMEDKPAGDQVKTVAELRRYFYDNEELAAEVGNDPMSNSEARRVLFEMTNQDQEINFSIIKKTIIKF